MKGVGSAEIAILVLVGLVPAAGLIVSLVYSMPLLISVVTGTLAAISIGPFLACGLAGVLAEVMPAMLDAKSWLAPRGLKLRIKDAATFKEKGLNPRLRIVYAHYLRQAVPALIASLVAVGMIEAVLFQAQR